MKHFFLIACLLTLTPLPAQAAEVGFSGSYEDRDEFKRLNLNGRYLFSTSSIWVGPEIGYSDVENERTKENDSRYVLTGLLKYYFMKWNSGFYGTAGLGIGSDLDHLFKFGVGYGVKLNKTVNFDVKLQRILIDYEEDTRDEETITGLYAGFSLFLF